MKGNKQAKGGKRTPPGGRPTNKEIAKKRAELEGLEKAKQVLEKMLGKGAKDIADKYLELAKADPATVRHAVDRILPAAKQQIEHTGQAGITLRIDED